MAIPTAAFAIDDGDDDDGRRRRGSALSREVRRDLRAVGLTKYLGQFAPAQVDKLDNDWIRYTYDTEEGNGPICVDGSDFRVFVQKRSKRNLLVFLPGGGACWQGQYACARQAPLDPPTTGIFSESFTREDGSTGRNPFSEYSKVVISYCDGSVYGGDNQVDDLTFPDGPIRYHRGVRNLSAGLDVASGEFGNARRVLFAGASAGGYGVSGLSALLMRFAFPRARLSVFNDSGPLNNPEIPFIIDAQINDWQFTQFIPESCTGCGAFEPASEPMKYWLANDRKLNSSLFSYDTDPVIAGFIVLPLSQYREVLLNQFDPIVAAYPKTYKRFVIRGVGHTIVGGPGFFTTELEGISVADWVRGQVRRDQRSFVDLVE